MSTKNLKSQLANTIKDADSDLKKRIEQAEIQLTKRNKQQDKEPFAITEAPLTQEPTSSKIDSIKVIKENYTMPDFDYELLETLRKRIALNGHILSKSETVRVALQALSKMTDTQLTQLATTIVKLKPGRVPSRSKI